MSYDKIQDLDKLLSAYLGKAKKIVDVKSCRLTATGENYGSILLKADITLKDDKNGDIEELHTVAKLIPSDELLRKVFNVQVSCKVEIAFYNSVVPALQEFQREKGVQEVIDFFPKMYAHRINLNGSDTVDENAVLLLENVAVRGYKNINRFEGFDLITTKLILKDLAAFHAVPLALKLQDPTTFQSKIKPHLIDHHKPPPDSDNAHAEEGRFAFFTTIFEMLEADEECKTLVPKLRELAIKLKEGVQLQGKEPFVSLGHGDLWVNNIMTRFEDGKPVANKFVDFQVPKYQSPAADLFFFFWTSIQKNILENHFDELLQFYHDCFMSNLHQLGCDSSFFSLEKLLEELECVTQMEVLHVVFMCAFVIFYKADKNAELLLERKVEDVPEKGVDRIKFMLKGCKQKGWL